MPQTGHDPHRYNSVNYQCLNYDMIHTLQSRELSLPQTGHDPHRYNPVNYQCHYTTGRDLVNYQCLNKDTVLNLPLKQGTITLSQ